MINTRKIKYIVAISAFALIGVVLIQISWILHAIELRETEFDNRVSTALFKTMDRLSEDRKFCADLKSRMNTNAIMAFDFNLESEKEAKIERILARYLKYYQIDLDFKFEIYHYDEGFTEEELQALSSSFVNTPYKCSLEKVVGKAGLEVRVHFPNKQKYVYAKMGAMLIGSLLFILLVTGCFYLTIRTIIQQKLMAERTTDFINNMTHEFKTPLATISLAANMIRRDASVTSSDKLTRYAGIIKDENAKLEGQVERVLDLARLERGEFTLRKEIVDVHEMLKSAASTLELQVKERQGEITYNLEASPHMVYADGVHISNVIMNLLDNANKYSPDSPKITVSTRNEEEGLVIAVQDNGIGMSKDKQKNVFDKFYRVPTGNLHNVKGFGLGLAYVKLMVDAHNGEVRLQSEQGKGSLFEVYLPAVGSNVISVATSTNENA